MDKVSIIILTKDNPKLIKDCIQSIQKYVKYPNYEIIIGDTGTKNKETLKYYNTLKDATIVRGLKYNFGDNYNDLIYEHCKSPYVVIQNNDTIVKNDYITAMMKYAEQPKVGAVGAMLLYPNGTVQHIGQIIFDGQGNMLRVPGHHALHAPVNDQMKCNYLVDGVTCACMMIKRDTFMLAGGFDTEYKDLFQDVDLNLELRHQGFDIVQCNDAVLIHYDNYTRKNEKFIDRKQIDIDKKHLYEKWHDKVKFIFEREIV